MKQRYVRRSRYPKNFSPDYDPDAENRAEITAADLHRNNVIKLQNLRTFAAVLRMLGQFIENEVDR